MLLWPLDCKSARLTSSASALLPFVTQHFGQWPFRSCRSHRSAMLWNSGHRWLFVTPDAAGMGSNLDNANMPSGRSPLLTAPINLGPSSTDYLGSKCRRDKLHFYIYLPRDSFKLMTQFFPAGVRCQRKASKVWLAASSFHRLRFHQVPDQSGGAQPAQQADPPRAHREPDSHGQVL